MRSRYKAVLDALKALFQSSDSGHDPERTTTAATTAFLQETLQAGQPTQREVSRRGSLSGSSNSVPSDPATGDKDNSLNSSGSVDVEERTLRRGGYSRSGSSADINRNSSPDSTPEVGSDQAPPNTQTRSHK